MWRSGAVQAGRKPHPGGWLAGAAVALPFLAGSVLAAPAAPKTPAGAALPPQTGVASYFGHAQAGKTTASGDRAKPASTLTAASPTLPLGTKAKVVNEDTGKSVKVTVVDRGPYAKHRVIDVSAKAARRLEMKKTGVAHVKVQPIQVPKHHP
jgi:rare lipoprotein A (peptidoglycan hydrolase)